MKLLERDIALEEVLRKTVSDIKRDTPRDKGDLESSVRWKRLSSGYKLYISDWKASFHEYARRLPHGTVNAPLHYISTSGKQATRPFIRPNVWRNMKKHKAILKQAIFKIYQGRQ